MSVVYLLIESVFFGGRSFFGYCLVEVENGESTECSSCVYDDNDGYYYIHENGRQIHRSMWVTSAFSSSSPIIETNDPINKTPPWPQICQPASQPDHSCVNAMIERREF